ncbi:MAG TPA: hypothetical protein VM778_12330, partial [Gemmatimonadota bacterium]|nr:hypothetical protein [Gemmatimonadota bacterium]
IAGTAGAVAGLSVLGHGGGAFEETLAVANVATGVTTAAFGIAALLLADADAAEGAPAVTTSGIEAALRLAPTMAPGPGLRPQLGLTVRF